MKTHWRLPRGVDELLPPAAWELESLRRVVLDEFNAWGYDYVEPPVIEYLESLLVGSGEDLDLQTLKVIDQATGKQLGVRADMTSQAVRIDAHSLVTDGVQRLCYAGPVVFANPQMAQASRVPFKAGAEIFGAPSLEADAEVINLMARMMRIAGVSSVQNATDDETGQPVLLLGHMGIYRGLVAGLIEQGALAVDDELTLFSKIQRKSESDIYRLLTDCALADMVAALPSLMGEVDVLDRAETVLSEAPESVREALAELRRLVELVLASDVGMCVRIDIAELSGYGYHNGPVFAVYHPQHGQALAQGGRYDGVGEAFGRARPATGFDVDLKNLIGAGEAQRNTIFAPYVNGDARVGLLTEVARLRSLGERVQCALSANESAPAACARVLKEQDGQWRLVAAP